MNPKFHTIRTSGYRNIHFETLYGYETKFPLWRTVTVRHKNWQLFEQLYLRRLMVQFFEILEFFNGQAGIDSFKISKCLNKNCRRYKGSNLTVNFKAFQAVNVYTGSVKI